MEITTHIADNDAQYLALPIPLPPLSMLKHMVSYNAMIAHYSRNRIYPVPGVKRLKNVPFSRQSESKQETPKGKATKKALKTPEKQPKTANNAKNTKKNEEQSTIL